MDWKMKLSEMLGLGADASDEDVLAAFEKKMAAPAPAMQSQQSVTEHPAYIALQGEVTDLATQLNAQSAATKRKDAVAFVDAAINEGRAGVKAARDEYIEMHMENPKRVAKLFGAMSIIKGAALPSEAAPSAGAADGLDDGDRHVIALMGLSETEYQESLAASGNKKAL